MKTIIFDKLIEYSKKGKYPLHMPGHKRQIKLMNGIDPFQIDITEIEGFDNLHHATGIIKESMDQTASIYESNKSWYLVNGSSCGILAAIGATTKIGDTIIIGRNCHKSVYHSIKIRDLKARYIYPDYIEKYGTNGGYNSGEIDILMKDTDAKVVVITSPTYDGIVSDIEAIAQVVHKNNGILIVDQAHGAHFNGSYMLPESAGKCGADIVIESVHKTLPSMTQTALMHLYSDRVEDERIEENLSIYQTSSPSYVMMASIEKSIDFLYSNQQKLDQMIITLREFRDKVNKLENIFVLEKDIIGSSHIKDVDDTKLVIGIKGKSGKWLADKLRENGFEPEMEAAKYVLGIMTICDDKSQINKLYKVLKKIDKSVNIEETENECNYNLVEAESVMTIYEADCSEKCDVDIEKSEGEISGDFVYLYPPGIPLIVPGERITKEVVEQILNYKNQGYEIEGMKDKNIEKIQVVEE